MKKLLILASIFLICIPIIVKGDGLDIVLSNDGNSYYLLVSDNGVEYSYTEAVSLFGIDKYMMYYVGDETLYFYNGSQISENEYLIGSSEEEANALCEEYADYCIRVTNTDEIINALMEIRNKRESEVYHLVYSSYDYNNNIDINYVNYYISENYITDINKNMYKYEEYAYYGIMRSMPYFNENEIKVDFFDVKITLEEEYVLNDFLEYFLPLLEDKSDYEKILGSYIYLSNSSTYIADEDGYDNLLDAKLSAYDVLLKKEHVCIGMATTFQLLMEKLGIESYIVDDVYVSEDVVGSVHTYNVVKFNDKWYIVDVASNSLDGFLINADGYDDTYYYGTVISDTNYLESNTTATKEFTFDYDAINAKIEEILGHNSNEEETKTKNDINKNYIYYIILGIILFIIWIVIKISIRKDKK